MPDGIYIFGGSYSGTTSDFLPKSSKIWKAGPSIPGNGISYGCGVRISNTEIVFIDGVNSYNIVIRYNTKTKKWTKMSNLRQARLNHGCALINGKIIVSGGEVLPHTSLGTEIIPLSTGVPRFGLGGSLITARHSFGMLAVGERFPRLLAFGGLKPELGEDTTSLNSIEEWNDDKEEWLVVPFSMKALRYNFGYLALPQSTICKHN